MTNFATARANPYTGVPNNARTAVDLVRHGGADPTGGVACNAAFTSALAKLDPVYGGRIIVPEGLFLVSSSTIDIDQPNVTIEGRGPGTVFKKSGTNRVMIRVGKNAAEGVRVKGFACRNVKFDGQSFQDATDDYPCLHVQYADNVLVEGCTFVDASHGVRFGRGDLAWSLDNQRARYVNCMHNYFENIKFMAIEVHGVELGIIGDNKVKGGALTDNSQNVGIRILKNKTTTIRNNIVDGVGRSCGGSGDTLDLQEDVKIVENQFLNPTYEYCLALSGPMLRFDISRNKFRGLGVDAGTKLVLIGNSTDDITQLMFNGNEIENVNTYTTEMVRFQRVKGSIEAKGNKFYCRDQSVAQVYIALHMVSCDGLAVLSGNTFDIDRSDAVAIKDTSGAATLRVLNHANVFSMEGTAPFASRSTLQSSSSGVIITGSGNFDTAGAGSATNTNAYIEN